jgi:hypothetical protein
MKRNHEFPTWQCIGQPGAGRFGGIFYNQPFYIVNISVEDLAATDRRRYGPSEVKHE